MTIETAQPAPTQKVAPRGFRTDVQGLRAVAVVAVIADHFAGWPHGGFVGVDIFFVISGFLITGLLMREFEARGTISFLGFYGRRFKRIGPAATFVLWVVTCAGFALLSWSRFKELCWDVLSSFFFVGNWHFANAGVDYFRKDLPPSPVQHYWSLSVEEQFYLVWPWLMLGVLLLGIRMGWWGQRHGRAVSGALIALITVASFAWSMHETTSNPTYAYFSTFSRTWELGLGALVAIGGGLIAPRLPRTQVALGYLGLAGIVTSLFVVPEAPGFPAPWAALPVLSTAAILLAGSFAQDGYLPPVQNRVTTYLGDVSYSLYLWHFPVCVLLLVFMPYRSLGYWVVGTVLIFGLSVLCYRYLETPTRKAAWFKRTSSGGLIPVDGWLKLGAVCVAIGMLSLLGHSVVSSLAPDSAKRAPLVLAGQTGASPEDCFGAAALDPTHGCAELNDGEAVLPRPADASTDNAGFSCTGPAHHALKSCEYGSERADAVQVALVGDSHAGHLQAAIVPQLEALNWRLTTFLGVDCKLHEQNDRQLGCDVALPEIQRQLDGGFDLVITSGTREMERATKAEYTSAMNRVLASGAELAVVSDGPEIPADVIQCVDRIGFTPSRECGLSEAKGFASPDVVARAGESVGAEVISTKDLYCRNGQCPAAVGNVLVYRDTAGHITATYARTMGPYLIDRIRAATGIG